MSLKMNTRAHKFGGAMAGGAVASPENDRTAEIMVEVLASAGGGMVGAKFPDWIDPGNLS